MSYRKSLGAALAIISLAGCTVSKMKVSQALDSSAQDKMFAVCSYSKTFGQLDSAARTDTPVFFCVHSGYFSKDHFSVTLKAKPGKRGNDFYIWLRASGGKHFVKNVPAAQRHALMAEIRDALNSSEGSQSVGMR